MTASATVDTTRNPPGTLVCRAVPSPPAVASVEQWADGIIRKWQAEVIRRQYVEDECPKAACAIIGPPDPSHPQYLRKGVFFSRLSTPSHGAFCPPVEGQPRRRRVAGSFDDGTHVPPAFVIGLTVLSGLVDWQPDEDADITLKVRLTIEGSNGEFGWCETDGKVDYDLLHIDWQPYELRGQRHITWLEPGENVPDFFLGAFPCA